MDELKTGVIGPVAILKESVKLWIANFVAVVLIYGVNVLLSVLLGVLQWAMGPVASGPRQALVTVAMVLAGVVVAVLGCFVWLIIINYIKNCMETKQGSLRQAFGAARSGFAGYIKMIALLFAFFLVVGIAATLLWAFGRHYYWAKGPQAARMAVLLASNTISVVLAMAAAWYGFFFSLSPLIAAFEQKGIIAALRESKSRIRGNALRLLAVFSAFAVSYFCLAVLAVFVSTRFISAEQVLMFIDPAMVVVFMPLALTIWCVSYKRLTELKGN